MGYVARRGHLNCSHLHECRMYVAHSVEPRTYRSMMRESGSRVTLEGDGEAFAVGAEGERDDPVCRTA